MKDHAIHKGIAGARQKSHYDGIEFFAPIHHILAVNHKF
jgi:hypothetical protein